MITTIMIIMIIIIHGKSQDQYLKNQGDGDSNFTARHKMFPYVLECYGAGKSVTPNNDCKTLTIFCFRGKSPNLSKRVLDDIFRQSTVQKLLDLLVFVLCWSLQMVWVSFSQPKLEGTWFHLSRFPSKVKRNIGRQNPMEVFWRRKPPFSSVRSLQCHVLETVRWQSWEEQLLKVYPPWN